MNQIFPISSNNIRYKTPALRNGFSTFNNFSPQLKSNSYFLGTFDSNKDSDLTSYYKELFLNQVNIKLDERVYDLISKMDDKKQYNEAKEQYDEAKRKLIKEAMNDKFNSHLNINKNANRINLKNYVDKINQKYSFDEKDNQLMYSLFTKLKTRQKKVYKFKTKNYLEKLFQGNTALYKKRKEKLFEIKKKPEKKVDMKLLIKSNNDLEEHIDKNKKKKVLFDEKEDLKNSDEINNNNNEFKRVEKKKRTFLDKKSRIKDYFTNLNIVSNRRKSFIGTVQGFNTSYLNNLNSRKESIKNLSQSQSKLNLPNIKEKVQLNNSNIKNRHKKNSKDIIYNSKIKEIRDSKTISYKESEDNINTIEKATNAKFLDKKESSKIKYGEKKSSHSILKNNDNGEKIKSSNLNLLEKDIKDIYHKININNKKQNKRTRNKVNEKNNNHKHYYINSTAREILSELNEKEKRLTKSTFKLNKSLIYFKNTNENFHTKKANKTGNFNFNFYNNSSENSKMSTINNIMSPVKKIGLMFKQVNENNSQFHFPLINKFFYQDEKGKIDMIDRIKFSLKQEYSEKLKEKKMNKRTIDGHEIINKLNDQYELEKLLEIAEMLKEKRRKEANFEIVD